MSIINDETSNDVLFPAGFGRGFDPSQVVPGSFHPMFGDAPGQLQVIPRSEWDARIAEQDALKSSLWHLRQTMADGAIAPTLDQNGQGYCWAYSTTRAVMYVRAVMGLPYVRLSAHAIGCKVKGFRDEGGWCGLSAKFHREQGCPSVALWPEKSMSRANDKPEVWANAAGHKLVEDWCDAGAAVYDQNLTFDQVATCLLVNIPVAVDFNFWSHSVCAIQLVRVEAGSYGIRIDNSWTDQWEDRGSSVLQGQKAIPDGAVALRAVAVSNN